MKLIDALGKSRLKNRKSMDLIITLKNVLPEKVSITSTEYMKLI